MAVAARSEVAVGHRVAVANGEEATLAGSVLM
jgi:hypothetical protein